MVVQVEISSGVAGYRDKLSSTLLLGLRKEVFDQGEEQAATATATATDCWLYSQEQSRIGVHKVQLIHNTNRGHPIIMII